MKGRPGLGTRRRRSALDDVVDFYLKSKNNLEAARRVFGLKSVSMKRRHIDNRWASDRHVGDRLAGDRREGKAQVTVSEGQEHTSSMRWRMLNVRLRYALVSGPK